MATRTTAGRVRLFLGPAPEIVRLVLRCSVVRRTEMAVDFHDVDCRWQVPARCGGQGRAAYVAGESLCLADVWGLWTAPSYCPAAPGVRLWRPAGDSPPVFVVDCRGSRDLGPATGAADLAWGGLVHYGAGGPWLCPDCPQSIPWKLELSAAIHLQLVTAADVTAALGRGELHQEYERYLRGSPGADPGVMPAAGRRTRQTRQTRPPGWPWRGEG